MSHNPLRLSWCFTCFGSTIVHCAGLRPHVCPTCHGCGLADCGCEGGGHLADAEGLVERMSVPHRPCMCRFTDNAADVPATGCG